MNLKKLESLLKKSSISLLALINGCVTIPNTSICHVAGSLSAGAICSETQTDKTWDLTFKQTIEMIIPEYEEDLARPGYCKVGADKKCIVKRAGAIFMTARDYTKWKTALQQACRELGSSCSYELKRMSR